MAQGPHELTSLRAFVGRSFLEADNTLWHEIQEMLSALHPIGFRYEDAAEAQACLVSDKVKEGIARNDIYLGVLARRHQIHNTEGGRIQRCLKELFPKMKSTDQWTTSEWVVEEVGYAIGVGRPVIMLIEQGVVFPGSDLDGDTEWIPFSRGQVNKCQSRLTQMLAGLVAKQVVPLPRPQAAAASAIATETGGEEPTSASMGDRMAEIVELAKQGNTIDADERQGALIAELQDEDSKVFFASRLLRNRALVGDTQSLTNLKKILAESQHKYFPLINLAAYHEKFDHYDLAAETIISNLPSVDEKLRSTAVLEVGRLLCKAKRFDDAKKLLNDQVNVEVDEDRLSNLFVGLADVAKAVVDEKLETASLEKSLDLSPAAAHVRFRLAYLYGSQNQDELAAYHYQLIRGSRDRTSVHNNLGVTYAALGLKSAEISTFEAVADEYALAKANLADGYAERGFLRTAEDFARKALGSGDELAEARARYVLGEIQKKREDDEKAIAAIAEGTKPQRTFLIEYANAYMSKNGAKHLGTYVTRHGHIKFVLQGNVVTGTGSATRTLRGLGAIAGVLGGSSSAIEETIEISLSGELRGLAGTFKLHVKRRVGSDRPQNATETTYQGLFVVAEDEGRIKFLELDDKNKGSLSEAGRIQEARDIQ